MISPSFTQMLFSFLMDAGAQRQHIAINDGVRSQRYDISPRELVYSGILLIARVNGAGH